MKPPSTRWLPLHRLTAFCALASVGLPVAAQPAIQLTAAGTVFDSSPYTLGFAFSVTTDMDLVGLGVYDHAGDGLEAPAQVALWVGSATLATLSVVVPGGLEAQQVGDFRFAPVAPLRLQAGQVYVVASYLDGGWASSFGLGQGGSATLDPRLTLLGNRFGDGFFELVYPGQADGDSGAWLGANLLLAAVPEPAPAAMLVAGLAALAWRRRSAFSRAC